MRNKCVGMRIRKYRKRANLSQEKLAEKVGLSVIAISNIERGVNYPSFENFITIANVLSVSADALLVDVVNNSYKQSTCELSQKIAGVERNKQLRILAVVDTLLAQP